jgi:SAM-dependent methyltransferase
MAESPFDDLTDVYEAIVDWAKRLANEEPFYRGLFERAAARSVVDVACGTGRHAAMFHDWGLRVEAADVSPAMIHRARARFGEPPGLRWVLRAFDEPIPTPSPFDVAICVGNSLALAPDTEALQRALARMLAAVRNGGLVFVHVLNLWHLPDGPCVWQKCKRADLAQGEVLIAKGVHRSGSRGYVDLLVAPLAAADKLHTESVPFLGIEAADLEVMAKQAGATNTQCFGNYRLQPYNRHESADLVMIAEK